MSQIDNIGVVNIIKGTQGVTRVGFGTPFLLSYHHKFADKYKRYNSLAEVSTDFAKTSVEYIRAASLFDSTTKDNDGTRMLVPEKIYIGRLSSNVRVDVLTIIDGYYKITINNSEYSFSASGNTKAEIASGLVALIGAGSEPVTVNYTASNEYFEIYADVEGTDFSITIDDTDKLSTSLPKQVSTLTFDADLVSLNVVNLNIVNNEVETAINPVTFNSDMETTMGLIADALETSSYIESAVVSANPFRTITITAVENKEISLTDIVVTLGASQASGTFAETSTFKNGTCKAFINSLNFQDYYFVLYARDLYDNAEIVDLSDFIENWEYKKALFFNTLDTRVIGGTTNSNIAAQIKQKAIDKGNDAKDVIRTVGFYTETSENYIAEGLIGACGGKTAGTITWAYQKAKLATTDDYVNRDSAVSFLRSNNMNYYTKIGGLYVTSPSDKGGQAIGGEYFDITRGSDWLQSNLEFDMFESFALNDKIPFTNKGASILINKVYSRMLEAQANGFLSDDEDILVTATDVNSMTASQRQSRIFDKIVGSARFAGAIQKVYLQINLTY